MNKKLQIFFAICILFASTPGTGEAAYVGNQSERLQWGQFRLGARTGYYLRDLDLGVLKADNIPSTIPLPGTEGDGSGVPFMATGTLGVSDGFNLHGHLGGQSLKLKGTGLNVSDADLGFSFTWGAGASGLIKKFGPHSLTYGGYYTGVDPGDKTVNGVLFDSLWQEWQLQASYAFHGPGWSPYGGIRYSDVNNEVNARFTSNPGLIANSFSHSQRKVGLFGGIDWEFYPGWKVNAEGRVIDEWGFNAGVSYRFDLNGNRGTRVQSPRTYRVRRTEVRKDPADRPQRTVSKPGGDDLLSQAVQHYEAGDKESSWELFHQVLAKNPSNYRANFSIGSIYFEAGQYSEAIPYYKKALDAEFGDIDTILYLGYCLLYTGNREDAERAFRGILIMQPDHPQASEALRKMESE